MNNYKAKGIITSLKIADNKTTVKLKTDIIHTKENDTEEFNCFIDDTYLDAKFLPIKASFEIVDSMISFLSTIAINHSKAIFEIEIFPKAIDNVEGKVISVEIENDAK